MDPIANIKEQLELARAIRERSDSEGYPDMLYYQAIDAERLSELVLALDEWMRKGGFSPWEVK